MKKYILSAFLFSSIISFPADKTKYHTWLLLKECDNPESFETESTVKFIKDLSDLINHKEKTAPVLTNEELLHQGIIDTGFNSTESNGAIIFCTTMPTMKEAHIDIYTEELKFVTNEITEFCMEHFEASSYGVTYALLED